MKDDQIETLLRERLHEAQDGVWFCTIPVGGPEPDVEIEVLAPRNEPSTAHVRRVASCQQLRPAMERALNAAPASDPLFPPERPCEWWLESISFTNPDSSYGQVVFTLSEPGYEYIYVAYHVEVHGLEIGRVYATTR